MPLDTSYAVQRLMTDVPRTLKPKHVQLLVNASYDTPMSQLFNQLHPALNSGNWVIVFKALSLIHLLSRQGNSDRVLGYLAGNKEILSMEYFRDRSGHPMGSFQSKNIAAYANYLSVKTDIYRKTKSDFVANREEHQVMLKTSESAPELILKCEQLQTLIEAACKCNWEREDLDHIVVRQAYRLMLADMMALFQLMNEGVVAVLGLYFLMPRPDALKALSVYKTFAVQAKKAVDVFNQGRKMKHELGMDIPSFSHPPLELANSLEAYVNAPDFEQQREAYAKKKGKKTNGFFDNPSKKTERVEKVEKDKPLIDFFDSLDTQVDQFRNEPAPAFNAFWDPNSEAYSPHSNGNPFNTADIIQQQQQLELQMQETNRMLQQQQNPFSNPSNPFMSAQTTGISQFSYTQPSTTFSQVSAKTGSSGMPMTSTVSQSNPFADQSSFGGSMASSGLQMNARPLVLPQMNPQMTGFSSMNPPMNTQIAGLSQMNPQITGMGTQFTGMQPMSTQFTGMTQMNPQMTGMTQMNPQMTGMAQMNPQMTGMTQMTGTTGSSSLQNGFRPLGNPQSNTANPFAQNTTQSPYNPFQQTQTLYNPFQQTPRPLAQNDVSDSFSDLARARTQNAEWGTVRQ